MVLQPIRISTRPQWSNKKPKSWMLLPKARSESRRKARTDMLEMIRPNSLQHLGFLVRKRPRSQHAATYQMISVVDLYRRSEEALPTGHNLCVYDFDLNLTRLLIYSCSSFLDRSLDRGVKYIYFPNNLSCCLVTWLWYIPASIRSTQGSVPDDSPRPWAFILEMRLNTSPYPRYPNNHREL